MSEEQWEQVARMTEPGSRLLRTKELKGGVSAQVTLIEIEKTDGSMKKLVVRQHGAVDRNRNPEIAKDEFKLLQGLVDAGLPVPQPYAYDATEFILPTPYIVTDFVDGFVNMSPSDLSDAMQRMAGILSDIHQVDWTSHSLDFLPEQLVWCSDKIGNRPRNPDESLNESTIRDVLESAWPLSPLNKNVLLHGDYWPGNILWKDNGIAAVIDWEDAAIGDPMYDLANSRLEVLWAYGTDAMHEFTRQYQALNLQTDISELHFWDLFAALKPASSLSSWGLDSHTEKSMREKHQWFTDQALARLHTR
ncbi:hypothetical protein J23TS9_08090 [Paenibacillus sp. J23TS9]|uniref:phosphotransferase family protein n=1 Tax=Paenibacillus sp. J23TS9 TaxID=2807193 RepID=UPI001AFE7B58|nr:phosphotransferase [Paenibacillus sp. J23TS9]GIP25679.1 hypothetical protein J23TS9_08090 [Paenibacillus sp. J23TS9]